jgi:hypothetical protein
MIETVNITVGHMAEPVIQIISVVTVVIKRRVTKMMPHYITAKAEVIIVVEVFQTITDGVGAKKKNSLRLVLT